MTVGVITSLRAAVTAAGGTPSYYSDIELLRQLVSAYGGAPTQWSTIGLLREAIVASGGTPATFEETTLLRQLVTVRAGTPSGYSKPDLAAQVAAVSAPLSYNLTSYYAAMSAQPDATQKSYLQMLADQINAEPGLMGQIRWLSTLAAHDLQATRVNMVHPSEVATIANGAGTGMTYTQFVGLQGDGTGAYYDTGIADNNAAPWTQNSAFIYTYAYAAPVLVGAMVGLTNSSTTRIVGGSGVSPMVGRIHGATAVTSTTANSFNAVLVNRTGANTIDIDRDGVLEATNAASASAAPVTGTICAFRNNTVYGDCALSILIFGGALTPSQKAALHLAVMNYFGNIALA